MTAWHFICVPSLPYVRNQFPFTWKTLYITIYTQIPLSLGFHGHKIVIIFARSGRWLDSWYEHLSEALHGSVVWSPEVRCRSELPVLDRTGILFRSSLPDRFALGHDERNEFVPVAEMQSIIDVQAPKTGLLNTSSLFTVDDQGVLLNVFHNTCSMHIVPVLCLPSWIWAA